LLLLTGNQIIKKNWEGKSNLEFRFLPSERRFSGCKTSSLFRDEDHPGVEILKAAAGFAAGKNFRKPGVTGRREMDSRKTAAVYLFNFS